MEIKIQKTIHRSYRLPESLANDFEQAVFTRSKLIKKLNYLPEKEEPAPAPKPEVVVGADAENKEIKN